MRSRILDISIACLIFVMAIMFLSLQGCASDGLIPITDSMVTATGDVVENTIAYTRDASIAKENEVHKTLRNRDKMIKDSHARSGMKMTWQALPETVFYPGMKEAVTVTRYFPVVEYREPARFEQRLPTEPSKHPVWAFAESFGNNLVNKTFLGLVVTETASTLRAGVSAAAPKYNGDVQFNQSHNQRDGIGPVDNSAPAEVAP